MAKNRLTALIPRTHRELCEIAERWLLGTAKCRVAIAEPNCIATYEQPDAIGFKASGSILVEAKTSRADFRADANKPFRVTPTEGMGNERFYICEPGIISVEDLPEKWGLLHVTTGGRVKIIKCSDIFRDINQSEEIKLLTACLCIFKPLRIKPVWGGDIYTHGERNKQNENNKTK